MRYNVTDQFTKISETAGTIQNVGNVYPVEVSDKAEPDSGILLYPLNKISFANKTLYIRCVDGAGAEVVVVPFEVDAGGGGGSSGVNADFSLDQFGTDVIKDFKFSALEYPNAPNPNLDGKTVLVMAVKDANETTQLVKYIFVDLTELVSYATATPLSDGLMSAADKTKLDGLKNYTLPTASTSVKGGVMIGDGLSMVGEVLNVTLQPESYTLPTASASVKGGIIVGSGLEMSGDILNASTYTLPTASTTQKGGVKIGTGLAMDGEVLNANEYTLPTASTSTKGGVKIGNGLSMNGDSLNCTIQPGTNYVAGKNVTISGDTITAADTNTTYSVASTSANGLMSSTDKAKLNNLASITTAGSNITISNGTISGTPNTTYTAGSNITISGTTISGTANTTYSVATTSDNGLMSSTDKAKLNNLASITTAGANVTISGGTISAGVGLGTVSSTAEGSMWIEV